MFEVRCSACLRVEEWDGPDRLRVRFEGGARRPAEPAPVAAWRALADALDHGRIVRGACPACGQPLTTTTPGATPVRYAIELPGAEVVFNGREFVGANGPIWPDEARRRIEAALPPPPPLEVGRLVFTTYVAGLGGVGLLLWIAAAAFVVFFLVRGAQTGQLWGQRGGGIYESDLPDP